MIQLRPYQLQAIDQIRSLMRQGCKSILYTAPTGAGKTCLTAHMLHTAASKGMRSLFIVHRRELIHQSSEAFKLEGLDHGIISAGFTESPAMRVQLASMQTLARRIDRLPEPKLIIWDECHHIAAASWSGIFRRFPHAYHIGLTATPIRLDGRGFGDYFQKLIYGPSVATLISQGYLSPYRLYAPMQVSVEGVHTKMGDYISSELSQVMDKPSITGDAVAHYNKYCAGKRAIVFAVSIQHSQHIVERFNQEGIHAEHVDGETPANERDEIIGRFAKGDTQILSNVDLFGEGFDVPEVEVIISLRPTRSLGVYLQQIGRGLRRSIFKPECIILDHVGNVFRHGLPDEGRRWSLTGIEKRSRQSDEKSSFVRICPKCFAAMPSGLNVCKFCGEIFPIKPREVEQKEGELAEITARRQLRQQQGMAQSLEDLWRIGVARGYRNPRAWAWYVFKGRQARKLGKVA